MVLHSVRLEKIMISLDSKPANGRWIGRYPTPAPGLHTTRYCCDGRLAGAGAVAGQGLLGMNSRIKSAA